MADNADISDTNMDVAELPPSTTTISTVAVQAGKAKIILAILRSGDWIKVRIHQMEPELMNVGSSLEEALHLQHEHDQLLHKLQKKEDEVKAALARADTFAAESRADQDQSEVYAAMAETLGEAWKDLNSKLEYRSQLLASSIDFYQSAKDFTLQMEQAHSIFTSQKLASDIEMAKMLLQQHQDMKRGILEASKQTLEMGHGLLEQIQQMGVHVDVQNQHATTAACYGIETVLEQLQDRRRYLEELWQQRLIILEQCYHLLQLDLEVNRILQWYNTIGKAYLDRTQLGHNTQNASQLQTEHAEFEVKAREVHDTMLRLIRSSENILSSGCVNIEGIRERLHLVDQESERFMMNLDERRHNINIAIPTNTSTLYTPQPTHLP